MVPNQKGCWLLYKSVPYLFHPPPDNELCVRTIKRPFCLFGNRSSQSLKIQNGFRLLHLLCTYTQWLIRDPSGGGASKTRGRIKRFHYTCAALTLSALNKGRSNNKTLKKDLPSPTTTVICRFCYFLSNISARFLCLWTLCRGIKSNIVPSTRIYIDGRNCSSRQAEHGRLIAGKEDE